MFRQIVSNLPFSPTLVGQLGFYAKRLKKEEATRRAGLILTALALVVQSLTVFTPPQAANAASDADFVHGGTGSLQQFLSLYDANHNHIKGLFDSLGVTRAEIAAMKDGKIKKNEVSGKYNWSRIKLGYAAEQAYTFNDITFWNRPLKDTKEGTLPYPVFEGRSAKLGYFAIKKDCGNLITTKRVPPPPPPPKPVLTCSSLNVKKLSAGRYRATAKATAKNTTIKSYRFTIEDKNDKTVTSAEKTASVEFSQNDPGTYTVKAFVTGDGVSEVSSAACKDSFTIAQPPTTGKTTPSAECTSLTVTQNGSSISLRSQSAVTGGAKIKGYTYRVKDASGTVVKTIQKTSASTTHSGGTFTQTVPGDYTVELVVDTSVGERGGGGCVGTFSIPTPPVTEPVAECKKIAVALVGRTTVSLSGEAYAENGASLKSYTFVVNKAGGSEVKRQVVTTGEQSAIADSFTLNNPGDYQAKLTVATSLGNKTGDQCATDFTIVQPNKCQYNPSLPENSPDCQPCPGDSSIWVKDEQCVAQLINTKTATNMTQGNVDATTVTARAGDRISYTLTTQNTGNLPQKTTVSEVLGDVLEYASITHNGGGVFNESTKTLSWPEETVEPGKKITHTVVVQVMDSIPTTNTGASSGASYDCLMTNSFGNATAVSIDCPAQKVIVEQTIEKLPSTGPTENMLFAGIVGSIVTFFYARSRQLGREVKLVRREFNMGTI